MNESKQRLKNVILILVYLLFVLVNIVANRLIKAVGLPLYLDNIGTLFASAFGGYLPGMFVGYITNIINSTADITNLYYAGVSVLIGVTAAFFARRGFYDSFLKALCTVPVLAFCGGVVGSGLTFLLFGEGEYPLFEQILRDFGLDIIDKAITVTAFYVGKKLLPESFTSRLAFTSWHQKVMTREEISEAKRQDLKGMSVSRKISLLISVIMIFIAFVTTFISAVFFKNFAMEHYTISGRALARSAASMIDGDRVEAYLNGEGDSADYRFTSQKLKELMDSEDFIEYVYAYQVKEDGAHVVFDFDTDFMAGDELGDVISYEDAFEDQYDDMLAGKPLESVTTSDEYGWLLISYEPVYDSDGNTVCYACCDINIEDILQTEMSYLGKALSLFLGFFLMIMVLFIWFFEFHLTYPIAAMTFATDGFDFNSNEDLAESVQRLADINITTNDEIEKLYGVLVGTITETVGYFDKLQEKSRQIEKMQSDLIYILADLVESRDKYTGDHIKKTASYVELMLELLKEDKIYPELVNDEYIHDVINCAPLHDVGKIKVPDAILNKPARLTDEEFEEMKKHTIAGRRIVESAKQLSGDSSYLDEALNMAAYHHEKWDGSGYPEGLKGEDIPLSARIMAIADVFDALLSKRSYKEGFSFEKAMSIIEEGKGTHFDPVLTEVFMKHRDRVLELVEKNSQEAEQAE